MEKSARIFITGHKGMVGGAIFRELKNRGYHNLYYADRKNLDLTNQQAVNQFFDEIKPEYVFLAAAKVGGIYANSTYPADFIYINSMIANNIIHACYLYKVKKLLNLGSSCIYPREAPQPLKENYLLTAPLEITNEAYAIAKILAIKLCRYYNEQYGTNFISAMPCNLYGPYDNFDLENSHFLPAIIRKISDAKESGSSSVSLWGDGSPRRELMYSEDLAQGLVFLMENYNYSDIGEFINIGSGVDHTIKDIAQMVCDELNFKGELNWDTTKPNGTMRKLMDVSRINKLGWKTSTNLQEGIKRLYNSYLQGLVKDTE